MRAPLCSAKRSVRLCARSDLRRKMERALLRAPFSSATWSVRLSSTPPRQYPTHHAHVERFGAVPLGLLALMRVRGPKGPQA
jgi:hypothetical protein